jgi:hypothetical protein
MSDIENNLQLLKSVSAPVTSKIRGKGFVRPNCSATFWLYCPVCCKRYFKYDSHFECFSKWCEICQDAFPTVGALKEHAQKYHKKNYCGDCGHVYENIRGHKVYEHSSDNTEPKSNTMKRTRKPKLVRATTATTC